MKRVRMSVALMSLCGAATLAACSGGSNDAAPTSEDCGTMTLAVVDDDTHRVGTWALVNDKVTSDIIDKVEVSFLQIPALIGATGSDQYQIVQTAVNAVPRAAAAGLDIKIVMLGDAHTGGGQRTWVRDDSSIDSVSDLKGKTVGTLGLGSTGYLFAAKTFQDVYGVDPAQENGDIKWVELDPATLLNAVRKGDVDAAVMGLVADWEAMNDPDLRLLGDMPAEYKELTGEWPVGSAYVVQSSLVDEAPKCIDAFQDLYEQSAAYANENVDEIGAEVAEETGSPLGWIQYFFDGYWDYAGIDKEWIARGQAALDVSQEFGQIPDPVNIHDYIADTGK